MLLDAGAEVDAFAAMYGEPSTPMSMLVSSCHPADAGLQVALAEKLLNYGAAIEGRGSGKWASPFWQIWDLLMLWLAMFHGTNGVRTIINDYAERDGTRLVLKLALYLAFTIVTVLGTLVIFTFDPCPPNAPAELLASFCTA